MPPRINSTAPGQGSHVVVPHDTNELSPWARALFVEVACDVAFVGADGSEDLWTVPAGTVIPVVCKKVLATGTTAAAGSIHAIH